MAGERLTRLSQEEAIRLEILYEQAETEILRELSRAIERGNQLDYLKGLLNNVQAILKDLRAGSRQWTQEAIPRLYQEGVSIANTQLKKLGVDASIGYGAIHQQSVQLLANATFERLDSAVATIGRRVEDQYRRAALEATRASIIGFKDVRRVGRDYRRRLEDQGVTGFKDAAGRDWNMKSYASMVARTTTMEAHLGGTANRILETGHDLVIVSTHANPCDKCRPWQGKVLSLTGATEGYPTLQEAKDAGLFHPNCEHSYGLYVDLDPEIEAAKKSAGADKLTGGPRLSKLAPENSSIPVTKVLGYALAQEHPRGRDKAVAFDRALGYNVSNYQDLIENIQRHLAEYPATFKGSTPYGDSYEVVLRLAGPNGKTAKVVTAWLVERDGTARLVSVYVSK